MGIEFKGELTLGTEVEVVCEKEARNSDGSVASHKKTFNGRVSAIPSQKFDREDDNVDFDFVLGDDGDDEPILSVSLDDEVVRYMHHDVGPIRDWDTYPLISVTIADEG